MEKENQVPLSRRRFLRTTAAGTAVASTLSAPSVMGAAANKFRVGLIGCGGRGTGAARNAREAGRMKGHDVEVYALADLFPDKTDRARRAFMVPAERCFTGFDAFKKLLDTDCDYVILATPPHFRAEHFEAAVHAGKDVFTEKPVAVDPPGIRRFLAAGEKAKKKGLSVAAGTQRRHQREYIETANRVKEGAIGEIVAGRCYWNQGGLWSVDPRDDWTDMEWQVRNWLYFTWLSGDHIVEQHVHNLDVINWFLGAHPVRARGMGGREVRTGKKKYGNIFDHFATELIYPSSSSGHPDVRVTSMCRQIDGCWRDVSEFVVGTRGSSNCRNRIWADGPWQWRFKGNQVNAYVQEHIDLQASMLGKEGALNEAQNVAYSTMTAILCRTSCYTGKEISWDELMKSNEKLGPANYEFGSVPFPDVPRPGKPM